MDRVIFQRSTLLLPEKQRTLPGERPLYHALRGPAACPQAAAAAHGVCELLDPLQGKGRQREGFEGNGHQLHGVVIPRHPVGAVLSPISRNNTAFWRAAARQEIYMEFLKNPPGAGERSACDLLHFRDGFEIKMNFDRNVSCFVAVYGFMDNDFFHQAV